MPIKLDVIFIFPVFLCTDSKPFKLIGSRVVFSTSHRVRSKLLAGQQGLTLGQGQLCLCCLLPSPDLWEGARSTAAAARTTHLVEQFQAVF